MKQRTILSLLAALLCLCLLLTACVKKKGKGNTENPSYIDSDEDLDTAEYLDSDEDLSPEEEASFDYLDSDEDMD